MRQEVHVVETSHLESFRETKTTNDIFTVIDENARNHHPKKVIVLDYDTK
jgi:hypothetical protein